MLSGDEGLNHYFLSFSLIITLLFLLQDMCVSGVTATVLKHLNFLNNSAVFQSQPKTYISWARGTLTTLL